jgi:hypothetical protein
MELPHGFGGDRAMRKRVRRFEDLLDVKHRWPEKGDRLLRDAKDWNRGVTFATDPIAKHAHLWSGYMSAGAGLIELCTQDGYEHERHFVIYPILFNYRHGLELAMKWTIVMYGTRLIDGIDQIDAGDGHNLWKLWGLCMKIRKRFEANDDDATRAVERIVKEFHDLDKAGITFRYGWSTNGKAIEMPSRTIDLENVRDVMDGVASYFRGMDGWLSAAGP